MLKNKNGQLCSERAEISVEKIWEQQRQRLGKLGQQSSKKMTTTIDECKFQKKQENREEIM